MSKIMLDAAMRSKLNGLNERLELCDETGETIGHFVPEKIYRRMLYQIAEAQCPYSAEELRRMRDEPGGRTLAEIWKELGQA